jgi:sugar lactone lactonase YvrE
VADGGDPAVSYSGRIVELDRAGKSTTLFKGIGNALASPDGRTYLFGLSDIAARGNDIYFVTGEGAWIQDPLYAPNRLMRLNQDGVPEEVFSFDDVEKLDPDGLGEDSNATGVALAPDNSIWVTDAAGNWAAHLAQDGSVLSVFTFPEVDSEQAVPTGITVGPDGFAYVALFHCRGASAGNGGIARLNPAGEVSVFVSGSATPIDVGFDSLGRMYVLEFSQGFAPNSGRLLRVDDSGQTTPVIASLNFPTSFLLSADGSIYISEMNLASNFQPGEGRVLGYIAVAP